MSKGKLLALCMVWLVIIGVGAMAWKWIIAPSRENAQQAQEEEDRNKTSDPSRYDHQISFALDSFSGYAIIRSQTFHNELAKKRIKLNLVDDNADYGKRFAGLKSGEHKMAAFTIDSLVKANAQAGDDPAVIVAIIDETRGADAMVAYKSIVPNIDALNHADTRFVLTPDSPSETLTRVVMTRFNLDNLSDDPIRPVNDANEVYNLYRDSSPNTRDVYVLWEPFVSKVLLENPEMHIVVDSSQFTGYIVDVIVASRDFLRKKPDIVREILGCYFRAAYEHRGNMLSLVMEDAKSSSAPLTNEQAQRLVDGIWWKNTKENFAHFQLQDYPGRSLQFLEDSIGNITSVLMKSGVINNDPTSGRPSSLFFSQPLRQLMESEFHPGLGDETVRKDQIELPELSESQWNQLIDVGGGTLDVDSLVFPPSRSDLTASSKAILDDLAQKLQTARYYLLIKGNASRRGNPEKNRIVAEARAQSAVRYLISKGIAKQRLRGVGVAPGGTTTVSFVLGELPY